MIYFRSLQSRFSISRSSTCRRLSVRGACAKGMRCVSLKLLAIRSHHGRSRKFRSSVGKNRQCRVPRGQSIPGRFAARKIAKFYRSRNDAFGLIRPHLLAHRLHLFFSFASCTSRDAKYYWKNDAEMF